MSDVDELLEKIKKNPKLAENLSPAKMAELNLSADALIKAEEAGKSLKEDEKNRRAEEEKKIKEEEEAERKRLEEERSNSPSM